MIKTLPIFTLLILMAFCANAQNSPIETDSLEQYSLAELDSIYNSKKKPQEQLSYALAMLQKGGKELDTQDTVYAKLLYKLGDIYQRLRDFPNATTYLQQAIDIQEIKAAKHTDYANSLHSLGLICIYQRQYEKTEELWLKVLAIRKEALGDQHHKYVGSLVNLGKLYSMIDDYPKSEFFYLEAKAIFKKQNLTQHSFYLICLDGLAKLYKEMGSYALAEPLYKEVINIKKEQLGDKHPDYAKSLNGLGVLYMEMGDYALAKPFYKEAINIQKEQLGDKHPDYANSLNNLAALYVYIGSYALAEPLFKEVINIRKEVLGEKHPEYANSLNNLGALYYKMGNYTIAEPLFKEALNILKEILGDKHLEYINSLINVATLSIKMSNYTTAETLYKEAINIRKEVLGEKHPDYATVLNNLANLYTDIGSYTLAETLYKESINIRKEVLGEKHPDYANSLNNLGNLYKTIASYDTAQPYIAQLLSLNLDYLDQQGATLGEKAKQNLFKTVAPYINRVNSFAALHCQHDSLLVLVQNGLLLTKGYALVGVSELLPLIKSLNDSTLGATYIAWTYTKTQLGKAYEMTIAERAEEGINIDSLQRLAGEQEGGLMQASAALKERLGYDKKRFYYKNLVNNIDKKEVAIDFVRFENENKDTAWYYALVTQQGWESPKYIPLCIEKDLQAYAMAEVKRDNENYITKPTWSKELYNLVIQPLEPYLKKKKVIHWSPVGLINQVAMGTLQDKKGKIFAERFELHQYGALKDFVFNREVQKEGKMGMNNSKNQDVLLVGDVTFDLEEGEHTALTESIKNIDSYAMRSAPTDSTRGASRFSRLPGTKVELKNLEEAFVAKKWNIQQLQQKEALEERIHEFTGENTPLVLHFATHGFFIPAPKMGYDNPLLRSGIALAGANRVWMGKDRIEGVEDGLWTAYEVANTNLMAAELVVLSACETARGQIDQNEGVVGLQRAFKIAGVNNMLLSLWQVPDKETVELMQAFYKHYLNGVTPSLALKKAQVTMRKKYPEPYYWAAFILIE